VGDKVIDFGVERLFIVVDDGDKFFELLLIFLFDGGCA
jgi:hypothetical protein